MPLLPTTTFSCSELLPAVPHESYPSFEINGNLAPGTYVAGQVLGELTATPGTFGAYATANVDGTGVAKAIMRYPATVDPQGNVSQEGEHGATRKFAPMYVAGAFRETDLTGLDNDALADLQARKVNGLVIL